MTARARRRARRLFYRLLYRLARLVFPTRVPAGPVPAAELRRVLVLANYFVGDVVVATPALSFLRAAAPGARVDVLTAPRTASLLAGDPRVDRVLVHDGKRSSRWAWFALARRLRRERYDLVADFVLPHHLREGVLTAFVAGRHAARVTPHRPVRVAGLFTHRPRVPGFERRYMAERLLYAVRAAVDAGVPHDRVPPGAGLGDHPLHLPVRPDAARRAGAWLADAFGDADEGPTVVLNAWASDPARSLAPAQAGAVAALLAGRTPHPRVVLVAPPGAADAAAAIVADARARLAPALAARVAAAPPSPDLGDLVALLARADAVLTPDTGVAHVAAALGRPTVAFYTPLGGTKMDHWAPRGPWHRAVAVPGGQAVAELPPAAVTAAFDALWAELAAAGRVAEGRQAERPAAGGQAAARPLVPA